MFIFPLRIVRSLGRLRDFFASGYEMTTATLIIELRLTAKG